MLTFRNITFLAQRFLSLGIPLFSKLEGNTQQCFSFAKTTLFAGCALILATPVHHIPKVFRCNFWMFHFDAKTPKRTSLWSSSASIGLFWTSKLKKVKYEQAKRERGAAQPRPCRSYRDAEGRVRYHGTSELKQTEFRVWRIHRNISPFFLQSLGPHRFFHMFAQLLLRQYTKCFAKKITSLVDQLKPKCDYVSHHDSVDAIKLWEQWSWDDRWLDAGMPAFIKYLYGARSLKIPADWAKVLPKRI